MMPPAMKLRPFFQSLLSITFLGLATVSAQEAKPSETKPEPAPEAKTEAKAIVVTFVTSKGTIKMELDAAKAPITVENFVKYVKKGHYEGCIFHRVIPNFMIQTGGFNSTMEEKPTEATIKNEGKNGLKNVRGSIAMARRGDPDSASAQFFINLVDNVGLDFPSPDGHGYAVFGKVTEGMDVVDAIATVPTTDAGPHQNVPAEPIVIKSATVTGAP
jgi:cyclophilin family peptidyl-prolyl cis-trans isomerase